jgi:hypothetical protein
VTALDPHPAAAPAELDPAVWVSVALAARITGRHPEAIRRWIREGVLPAIRHGSGPKAAWMVRRVDLDILAARPRKPGAGKRRG